MRWVGGGGVKVFVMGAEVGGVKGVGVVER